MGYRTVKTASFEIYLQSTDETLRDCLEKHRLREEFLKRFAHTVMLELSYPELDFANRWCWRNFGPHFGECFHRREGMRHSEYPVCLIGVPHSHFGTWMSNWVVKTDYDFGFNEWYFSTQSDRQRFLEFVPEINWGEHYTS